MFFQHTVYNYTNMSINVKLHFLIFTNSNILATAV
jgi:hypothetical protein